MDAGKVYQRSRAAAGLIPNTTMCQVDPGPSGIMGCGRERMIQKEGDAQDFKKLCGVFGDFWRLFSCHRETKKA